MSTTILTRPAADALGHIHDRTPVIVPADLQADWMDPGLTDKGEIRSLLDAIPDPELVPREVGKHVGICATTVPNSSNPWTIASSESY